MTKFEPCPACLENSFKMVESHTPEEPNEGWCIMCGFSYSSEYKEPIEQQAEIFKTIFLKRD